jgi:carbon monoxide dehydrogenase subunit G
MTSFSARNRSTATLKSSRVEIWKALTDPDLLPQLTPYLKKIDVDGDRWTWQLAKIPVMGKSIGSTFTEVMTFEEPERIVFAHDDAHTEETTWVEGAYDLRDAGSGTSVSIDLAVTSELPFPRLSRPAVEAAMSAVMAGMGRRFASNLLRHLGEK